MCRLFGLVTREPVVVSHVLQNTLTAMKAISHLHSDGWGFAWYSKNGQLQLVKSPEAAYDSKKFDDTVQHIQTSTLVGHLRWATNGLNVCMPNTHPFVYKQFAFAHNGYIGPINALEELIAPDLRAALQGTTDSERYFFALLGAVEQADTPVIGIQNLLEIIFGSLQSVAANCLFATPDTLYAVCAYNPDSARAQQEPDYFSMKYRIASDTIMVGSTGLGQDSTWKDLANGQMLVVNRGTLEVKLVELEYNAKCLQKEQYSLLLQQ